MTEGVPAGFEPFESGYDPADPLDRAIMATRNAVFLLHGLMPLWPATRRTTAHSPLTGGRLGLNRYEVLLGRRRGNAPPLSDKTTEQSDDQNPQAG